MNVDKKQCPVCGGLVRRDGADMQYAYYLCLSCGNRDAVPLAEDGNLGFALEKRELLGRIRLGMVEWQATRWDQLYTDLIQFANRYDAAQTDIQLQIGLVACITKGFNTLDPETYGRCKKLFKCTEKLYKRHLKVLKQQADPSLSESVTDYRESRDKYIKCRNEYRNTKLAWKAVFFVLKKLLLPR